MDQVNVTAKITGLHPATGLYLEAGKPYTIDKAAFSDDVFTEVPESSGASAQAVEEKQTVENPEI